MVLSSQLSPPPAGKNWDKGPLRRSYQGWLKTCIDFNKIRNDVNARCSVHAEDLMTLPSHDNENVKSRPTVLNNVDPAGAICINDVSTGARREVSWWLYTIDYTDRK